ncbi:MAG: hypothetical protein FJ291_04035 [Planctomycetes bacterium]|nr:hypothetical protein [Planctomycetota bacterium]
MKTRTKLVWTGVSALALAGAAIAICSCAVVRGCWHYHLIRSGMRKAKQLDKAHMDVYGNVPVVHLYGSPEEMGEQYGALLRQPLRSLATCIELFMPDEKKKRAARFAETLEKNLPDDARAELKAIAKASGVPYETVVAANVTPNILCTALAVWDKATPDGALILGRNSDYPAFGLEKVLGLIVVYHPDEGNPVVSVNYLGMIGCTTGINSEGVAFGNLLSLNAKNRDTNENGLPVQLHLRRVAHRACNADELARGLLALEHAAPMNVVVADEKRALVVELAGNGGETRTSEKGILAVSNHFLSQALASYPSRCARYDSLMRSAEGNFGGHDVEKMKEALFAAKIEGWNLHSVIFEPAKKCLHVSMNRQPASAGPYATFGVDALIADAKEGNVLLPHP